MPECFQLAVNANASCCLTGMFQTLDENFYVQKLNFHDLEDKRRFNMNLRGSLTHVWVATIRPPISVALAAPWLVGFRGPRAAVPLVTAGGREDGSRKNVQKKQQGAQKEDEGQTPVDGELQRRHVAPQVRSKSFSLLTSAWEIRASAKSSKTRELASWDLHGIFTAACCRSLGGGCLHSCSCCCCHRTDTTPRILSVLLFERLLSALFYTLETD